MTRGFAGMPYASPRHPVELAADHLSLTRRLLSSNSSAFLEVSNADAQTAMLTTPAPPNATSTLLHRTAGKPDFVLKSSCGDLQSRLKVRKVLGVGDTSCTSKISQILGQADNLVFQLPPRLTTWLLLVATSFSCFTVLGLLCPSHLRVILPGTVESTVHLAASYAFFATVLGLTLRSGDKTSLQLVLFSLTAFHALSILIAFWLLKVNVTNLKAIPSTLVHLVCLLINVHFYRSISRPSSRHNKLKSYFSSTISYPSPSPADSSAELESS